MIDISLAHIYGTSMLWEQTDRLTEIANTIAKLADDFLGEIILTESLRPKIIVRIPTRKADGGEDSYNDLIKNWQVELYVSMGDKITYVIKWRKKEYSDFSDFEVILKIPSGCNQRTMYHTPDSLAEYICHQVGYDEEPSTYIRR